jgi:hypothetical protein
MFPQNIIQSSSSPSFCLSSSRNASKIRIRKSSAIYLEDETIQERLFWIWFWFWVWVSVPKMQIVWSLLDSTHLVLIISSVMQCGQLSRHIDDFLVRRKKKSKMHFRRWNVNLLATNNKKNLEYWNLFVNF